jgi:two-component system, chemotaxis family, sensor kinase CheA
MEQQTNFNKLLVIKDNLGNLAEEELTGDKVQGILSALRDVLSGLESEAEVDQGRLANLATFVKNRQSLDHMVRKVLLGLISKLAYNPTATAKPAPNISDLMGKIPGLEEALKSSPKLEPTLQLEPAAPTMTTKKLGEMPHSESLIEKIPGLEEALKKTGTSRSKGEPEFELVSKVNPPAETKIAEKPVCIADTTAEVAAACAPAENVNFDTRELLGFFLQESMEQVEKFANGLLDLERNGASSELVNELFRSAHTLKGASGTMGFSNIVKLTHLSEDVLDGLRQEKSQVSPELIDVLLNVADLVRGMLADIQNGGDGQLDVGDLVDRLENYLGKPKLVRPSIQENNFGQCRSVGFELDEKGWATVKELQLADLKVYEITVKFNPNILMPSVRAVMAVRRLESYGRVLQTKPSTEELRKEKYPEFHILVATDKDIKLLERVVLQVAEINSVSSHPFEAVEVPVQVINVAEIVRQQSMSADFVDGDKPSKGESDVNARPFKNQTIRVQTERLDDLLNLVGEMVITRTRLVTVGSELNGLESQNVVLNSLNETTVYLGRLMNELQESVMVMRMVPIGQVFSRFPRLIRDLARKTGKEIELVCYGEETELDKTIIEEIGNPLMHLIRNSIDHGLESTAERKKKGKSPQGKITIEAFHEGSHIIIAVTDDGKGIDLNAVKQKAISKGFISQSEELNDKDLANLIFLPGLSTATQVTDVSGRGVGMDAVKKSLVNLGGMLDIVTSQGKGTTFTIRLPLTLAIIQALLVDVGLETYAIPLGSVLETLKVQKREIKSVGGHAIIQLRGSTLPLISLQEHLGLNKPLQHNEFAYVVVVGFGEKRLGLMVDGLKGQQEIVIKSLGELLANVPGFSGATISGDGKVTLILDVGSLIHDTLVNRI